MISVTAVRTCTRVICAAAAVLLVGAPLAWAHHSFAATYHADQEVVIEGRVVQFQFRNPHSFIHVLVTEPAEGSAEPVTTRWAVEWGSAGALGRERITRATLNPGDEVVVRGAPGRNADDNRMLLRHISKTADDWEWGGEFN